MTPRAKAEKSAAKPMRPCDFHSLLAVFSTTCDECWRRSNAKPAWRPYSDPSWPGPLPASLFEKVKP
jgi:hypothetical protein